MRVPTYLNEGHREVQVRRVGQPQAHRVEHADGHDPRSVVRHGEVVGANELAVEGAKRSASVRRSEADITETRRTHLEHANAEEPHRAAEEHVPKRQGYWVREARVGQEPLVEEYHTDAD